MRFCSQCGEGLSALPPTRCGGCGFAFFVDAKPGAGAIVVDGEGRFLALRRAQDPGRGAWGVPGGFCDGEHPEVAAVREVFEETGLRVRLLGLVGVYTGSYASQGEVFPVLHLYYLAIAEPGSALCPAPAEVAETRWCRFDEPPGPWAFPHLADVVIDAAALAAKSQVIDARRPPPGP